MIFSNSPLSSSAGHLLRGISRASARPFPEGFWRHSVTGGCLCPLVPFPLFPRAGSGSSSWRHRCALRSAAGASRWRQRQPRPNLKAARAKFEGGARGSGSRAPSGRVSRPLRPRLVPPQAPPEASMATPPKRDRPDGRIKKVAVEGNIGESAPPACAGKGIWERGVGEGRRERWLPRCSVLSAVSGRGTALRTLRPCLPPSCLFSFLSSLPLLPYLFPSIPHSPLGPFPTFPSFFSPFSPFPLCEGSFHYGRVG